MKIFEIERRLLAPEEPPAPGGGATPPVETPPKPAPAAVFETTAQLNERLQRHHQSQLKKLGIESDEDLQKLLTDRDARAKADDEARKAAMTREQVLADEKAVAERARDAAQAQAEEARFNEHVTRVCLEHGIRNLDYAKFLVASAADALPNGQQLDAAEFLKGKLADAQSMAALGVAAPPKPIESVTVPGATSPGVVPPNPPPPGGNTDPADAFKMDATAWAARRAALGMA